MKRASIINLRKVSAILAFSICFIHLFLLPIYDAAAYTNSGTISSDETWSGEINITADVTVPQNVILRIQPGTVIRFADNTGLFIYGKLEALGTAASPTVFIGPQRKEDPGIIHFLYTHRLLGAHTGNCGLHRKH